MSKHITELDDLRKVEQKVFQIATNDGVLDFGLGLFALMLAVTPLLSDVLGDFLASMIFLPVFLAFGVLGVYVRRRVVAPRMGTVRIGPTRRAKLRGLTLALLAVNIATIAGGAAVLGGGSVAGVRDFGILCVLFPVVFIAIGYALDCKRMFLYGLLLGMAPVGGEWLSGAYHATHHGWPIAYGLVAAIMLGTGTVTLAMLLRDNPVPKFVGEDGSEHE